MRRLKAGVFLYASPDLSEPNFSETVVLLVEYGPKGAMGLVINRPTQWKAREALKDASALGKLVVYWGGPVQTDAVFGLVRAARPPRSGLHVLDDVFMTGRGRTSRPGRGGRGRRPGSRLRRVHGLGGRAARKRGPSERLDRRAGRCDSRLLERPEDVWEKVRHLLDRLEARVSPTAGCGNIAVGRSTE